VAPSIPATSPQKKVPAKGEGPHLSDDSSLCLEGHAGPYPPLPGVMEVPKTQSPIAGPSAMLGFPYLRVLPIRWW